jgi:hypothetical protein
MRNIFYKLKNKIFNLSKEASKIGKPTYQELIKYELFKKSENNKFALSLGAGRCGQNWFAKIFNSHSNWIGTCERFSELEAFYRYITYYDLPIDKESFYKYLTLVLNRDFAQYKNSLIGSPYFSFGIEELYKKLKPNYIFFNIRNPVDSVESFFRKGWYLNTDKFVSNKGPLIDQSISLRRNFSRVVPNNEYFDEWINLTRIGKISWFWAMTNKVIFEDFNKIQNKKKFIFRLEDINQNFDFYLRLASRFNFENKMNKKKFYNVIYKAPNKGPTDKYRFKDWNKLEKKEFKNIIESIFPYYENVKTNI